MDTDKVVQVFLVLCKFHEVILSQASFFVPLILEIEGVAGGATGGRAPQVRLGSWWHQRSQSRWSRPFDICHKGERVLKQEAAATAAVAATTAAATGGGEARPAGGSDIRFHRVARCPPFKKFTSRTAKVVCAARAARSTTVNRLAISGRLSRPPIATEVKKDSGGWGGVLA